MLYDSYKICSPLTKPLRIYFRFHSNATYCPRRNVECVFSKLHQTASSLEARSSLKRHAEACLNTKGNDGPVSTCTRVRDRWLALTMQ